MEAPATSSNVKNRRGSWDGDENLRAFTKSDAQGEADNVLDINEIKFQISSLVKWHETTHYRFGDFHF